jgi:hypothetical protein
MQNRLTVFDIISNHIKYLGAYILSMRFENPAFCELLTDIHRRAQVLHRKADGTHITLGAM